MIGAGEAQGRLRLHLCDLLLDMLAMGIVIPVLPKLVVDFVNGDTRAAAKIFGLFGTAWALMQFVFSPVQGELVRQFRPPARDPHFQPRRLGWTTCSWRWRRRWAGCSPAG